MRRIVLSFAPQIPVGYSALISKKSKIGLTFADLIMTKVEIATTAGVMQNQGIRGIPLQRFGNVVGRIRRNTSFYLTSLSSMPPARPGHDVKQPQQPEVRDFRVAAPELVGRRPEGEVCHALFHEDAQGDLEGRDRRGKGMEDTSNLHAGVLLECNPSKKPPSPTVSAAG